MLDVTLALALLVLLYWDRQIIANSLHRVENRMALENVVEKARLKVRVRAVAASIEAKAGEDVTSEELCLFIQQEMRKIF